MTFKSRVSGGEGCPQRTEITPGALTELGLSSTAPEVAEDSSENQLGQKREIHYKENLLPSECIFFRKAFAPSQCKKKAEAKLGTNVTAPIISSS